MGASMKPKEARSESEEDALSFPAFNRARRLKADGVAAMLRSGGIVRDEVFDAIYPAVVRDVSIAHWTPVRVAARIVELLRLRRGDRLLDIGAGVGKFCVIAQAISSARVRGVERRPELVAVAREAARRYGVDVDLAEGSFETEDPRDFDALYLFNPFTVEITLEGVGERGDGVAGRTARDVAAAERFLERAPVGTRVVTFCGFGGKMPAEYVRHANETWDEEPLELWVKGSMTEAGKVNPSLTSKV